MPYHNWTTEEDNLLRDLIATKKYSFRQMAVHFTDRTGTALRKHALKYLNLRHDDFVFRKHAYNRTFFETPSPLNCYVAGYYAADGCITDNPTTRVLAICSASTDLHQMETFKKLLGYTGSVSVETYTSKLPNGVIRPQTMCWLRLYGAHQITADLKRNFGLDHLKMYHMPAPGLTDEHLKLCYLVGLFDGDGCVHVNVYGKVVIRYVSASRAIVEWVKTTIESMGLRTLKPGRHFAIVKEANSAAYAYAFGGYKALDFIRRAQRLKAEGIPILDRKWDNPRVNAAIKDFETIHGVMV